MPGTPFRYLHHLVTVPVVAGGHDTEFILDSGIGLTLVTDRFARQLGIEAGGETFTGRRMSGQAVELPLATLPSLVFDQGTAVDIRIESDGPDVTAFMPLVLPSGRTIEVEIDMGSDALILHDDLAEDAGVALDDPRLEVVDGRDETGHAYTRRFGAVRGRIHAAGAPAIAQDDPDVMFQAIRYEGLVGDAFLRRFGVTFDIPARRVVFS